MKTLVFCTHNSHKLTEVKSLLSDDYNIKGLIDIGCLDEIPETSDTLEGNAKLKSSYVKVNFNLDCFSDDTGLEVKSLNMEPGVFSARYAGPQRSSEDNVAKLLKELSTRNNRIARFRTAISLIIGNEHHLFDGIVNGTIATSPRGEGGFGYDSVFIPEGYNTTFAEMTHHEKNEISHRGLAVQKLVAFLSA
ncbi:MAG: non-canonical purine NTP diphosphatase [Flavobacteriales bacterium]